jgi:hypothetical protein
MGEVMRIRRGLIAGALVVTGGAVVLLPTTAASAAPAPCAAGTPLASDFDGDGKADAVVGAKTTDDLVLPGDNGGSLYVEDSAGLVSADLNGDTCADAILTPGQKADRHGGATSLRLVPGTPDGLDLDASSTVDVPLNFPDNDSFDYSAGFTTAGLRHDGVSQVAVAVNEFKDDGDGESYLGSHLEIFTLDAGLTASARQSFTFSSQVGEVATSGSTIALGLPASTTNGKADAGRVRIYTPAATSTSTYAANQDITQDSKGVPGSSETNDHFGATLAMKDGRLAIGVPEESDGKIVGAGSVQPVLWNETKRTYTAYRRIDQDTKGVPGSNEAGDAFGEQLAIARGLTASGSYDILIGATNEASGTKRAAGSFTVANLTKALFKAYTQASAGVPGSVETDDNFGVVGVVPSSSGADTILVGAPGENEGDDTSGYAIRSDGKKLTSKTKWTSIPIATDSTTRWGWHVGAGLSTWPKIITGE